jgi:hypothetical protein
MANAATVEAIATTGSRADPTRAGPLLGSTSRQCHRTPVKPAQMDTAHPTGRTRTVTLEGDRSK